MAATDASLQLELLPSLDDARDEWGPLAEAAGNPFATYEFAAAWWTAYGAGRRLALTRVRDAAGRVVALLPLYRADRGPVRLLRFVGHGPADRLGPVCAPADAPLAAAALRRVARELPAGGLLLAERLAASEGLAPLLAGAELRREASPVLPTAGRTWEEWLAGRSSNLRGQIRRKERKLVKEHGLVFRLVEDPAELDGAFDDLVRLHRMRWGEGSAAFEGPREAFHRDFTRRALDRGWLRLCLAELDGAVVAAWYGLRYAGRDWYYQSGRDPAWEKASIGAVIVVHTMRCAFEDGMAEYHFGLGDEPYKDRYAEADDELVTLVAGRPWAAGLAGAAVRAALRLPDRPRGLIARRAA